ncbi:MAG TPA: hypothetical protein VFZ67_10095 [Nitrososphaera sp.]
MSSLIKFGLVTVRVFLLDSFGRDHPVRTFVVPAANIAILK